MVAELGIDAELGVRALFQRYQLLPVAHLVSDRLFHQAGRRAQIADGRQQLYAQKRRCDHVYQVWLFLMQHLGQVSISLDAKIAREPGAAFGVQIATGDQFPSRDQFVGICMPAGAWPAANDGTAIGWHSISSQ